MISAVFPDRNESRVRGAALVITLALLALLSVVLVGLFLSARLEFQGSQAYLEAARARWLAREAAATATAQIASATGGTNVYVTQPGAIHVIQQDGTASRVNLFTYADGGDEVNLNRKGGLGKYPLDPSGSDLRLTWLYERKDGSVEEKLPSYDPVNPVIGRYAYWVDDLSARINLNTAWKRDAANTAPGNDPSKVELAGITGVTSATADLIRDARQGGWFVDPLEAARADAALRAPLEAARFYTTARSHSPEQLNCFGEPKIVLTTRSDRAGGLPYLDISTPAKTQETVDRILAYLRRTDWPVAKGSSFLEKYYKDRPERAPQLAYNIIDYVRAKESNVPIVAPTRIPLPAEEFLGLSRTPLVTEIGVDVDGNPNAEGKYPFQVVMEVHLPKDYGIDQVDLTGLYLWWSLAPNAGGYRFLEARITATECSPGPILSAGGYAIIRRSMQPFGARPSTLTMRVALSTSNGSNRFQLCPFAYKQDLGWSGNPSLLVYPVSAGGAATRTYEVADPRVNQGVGDWVLRSSANTLGTQNSIYGLGSDPGGSVPRQDTDANGKISDLSLMMPPAAGTTQNPRGLVESVAELGVIHTGMEGKMESQGIPWRTLRVQRSDQGIDVIPDWALLDLFAAPAPVGNIATAPFAGSVGGRINANAAMQPFDSVERTQPLFALWKGLPGREEASAKVVEYLKAPPRAWKLQGAFVLPGEVLEVPDVAGDELSERDAVKYFDQVTVKSNVFGIYALAQSLQQAPTGRLLVKGECLTETVVERVPGVAAGEVRFRTVSFQEIRP